MTGVTAPQGPLPHPLPFEAGPFRMSMGLMALKEEDWIEPDRERASETALRRSLITLRRRDVLGALPGTAAGTAELLESLAGFLPRHHPDLFAREGSRLVDREDGSVWDLDAASRDAEAALALVGSVIQEDVCLLEERGGTPVLTGGVLCFPSRWRLADKLGLPLLDVHGPVALYADRLGRPVDRFIAHLKPGRPVWRLNWSLHDDPALFQPPGAHRPADPPVRAADAGERLFLRFERQTLSRLPRSGVVVFTIRTRIRPLGFLAGNPEASARLAATLRALPPEVADYKGLPGLMTAALDWLDAEARPGA